MAAGVGRRGSLLLVLCCVLAACSRSETPASQVIARVNGDEVSIHQVNFALGRTRGRSEAPVDRGELVDKLINRQLAVQQALALKLDRRPDVMLRVEEARRDVLAAAYAEEVAGKLPAAGDQQIASYFADHPGLFAQRKVYKLREVVVPMDSPALDKARAMVQARQPVAAIVAMLRQAQSRFTEQSVVRPADQLPIDVADQLYKVGKGDYFATRLARGLVLYEIIDSEVAPMPWEAARPIIKAHLEREQGAAKMREEMDRLRAAATLERFALPE